MDGYCETTFRLSRQQHPLVPCEVKGEKNEVLELSDLTNDLRDLKSSNAADAKERYDQGVERCKKLLQNNLEKCGKGWKITTTRQMDAFAMSMDILQNESPPIVELRIVAPLASGHHTAARIISHCRSDLRSVYLGALEVDDDVIKALSGNLNPDSSFKVGEMTIGDIPATNTDEMAKLIKQITVTTLHLLCSDYIVRELVTSLADGCKIIRLDISSNKTLSPKSFEEIAKMVTKGKLKVLIMKDCELTTEKLKPLGNIRSSEGIALMLDKNKSMTPECYEHVANICKNAPVRQFLTMMECNLNAEKLHAFKSHIGHTCKFTMLWLGRNETLEPHAFRSIADIIEQAKVDDLWLSQCNMDGNKLDVFQKALVGKNVTLKILRLHCNVNMGPAAFAKLVDVLNVVTVESLSLDWCNLTSDKLKTFHECLLEKRPKVIELSMDTNKDMNAHDFRQVAEIAHQLQVKALSLKDCQLNRDKVGEFCEALKEKRTMLIQLDISKNASIEPEGWKCLVGLFHDTRIQRIIFNNCEITGDKGKAIGISLEAYMRKAVKEKIKMKFDQNTGQMILWSLKKLVKLEEVHFLTFKRSERNSGQESIDPTPVLATALVQDESEPPWFIESSAGKMSLCRTISVDSLFYKGNPQKATGEEGKQSH